MLEIIKQIFKILDNIDKYYIEELRKKDDIIKSQKKYIRELERFINNI